MADPGGVQGVRTSALLIRVPFLKKSICSKHVVNACYSVNKYFQGCIKTHHYDIRSTKKFWGEICSTPFGAFGTRPPVPLLDGLDTCRKILDAPLLWQSMLIFGGVEYLILFHYCCYPGATLLCQAGYTLGFATHFCNKMTMFQVVPSVHGIYFKDLKQTLRKEQCDVCINRSNYYVI